MKNIPYFQLFACLVLTANIQTVAAKTAAEVPSALCEDRLRMEVQSLKQDGPGTLVMTATYENLTNLNMRLAVYSGGARGRDTFLVSDTGETWPKVKNYKGGGGTQKIVFIPGVKMKTTTKFQIRAGGQDAKEFNLTNWTHLLAEKGMTGPDEGGWCKFEIRGLLLSE